MTAVKIKKQKALKRVLERKLKFENDKLFRSNSTWNKTKNLEKNQIVLKNQKELLRNNKSILNIQ